MVAVANLLVELINREDDEALTFFGCPDFIVRECKKDFKSRAAETVAYGDEWLEIDVRNP